MSKVCQYLNEAIMLIMLLNILAKFRLFQVLFDLIFEIREVCLMNLVITVITSVILATTLCALICFVNWHALYPIRDFPARRTLQSKEVWTIFTHKAMEVSVTVVGTVISGSTSICLITMIFYL